MKLPSLSKKGGNETAWLGVLFISLVLGYFLLQPYLGISIFGLLVAFVFYPVYDRLNAKLASSGKAAALTTVISGLVFAVPVVIVLILAVSQALALATDIANSGIVVEGDSISEGLTQLTANFNARIESWVGIKDAISVSDVSSFVNDTIPQVARYVADTILGIASGIPNFFTLLIVYLFVFTAGLTYGKDLVGLAKELSPFDEKTNNQYLERIGAMAKAMLKGQMLIALVQGIVSAAVLALVGFADYFVIMAVLFTFLSFIPLGAGIVTIPLGILLIALGNVAGGVVVLLNHFIVITNIDNYIRPKVVPDNAQLPAVLTILAAFGGVSMFGLIGVIYGPMIMIFITTTIESYVAYNKKMA